MGGFDKDGSQLWVPRLDKSSVGLPLATRCIARRESTEASQLFAGAKPIEPSDFSSQRYCCNQTDARRIKELLHDRIILGQPREPHFDIANLMAEPLQVIQLSIQDPLRLNAKYVCCSYPCTPRHGPGRSSRRHNDANISQKRANTKFDVASLAGQLLAKPNQAT
jgi:hypothetical protein